MPPKPKEVSKKPPPPIVRPSISDSSLVYVPDDAIEGFQKRIQTGIDWTLVELGLRRHRKRAQNREELPTIAFTQAFRNKIDKSILGGFLDENSNISLEEQWELILATKLWDNEKFATDEGKACFDNANCLTNDVIKMIKFAVKAGDRKVLWKKMMTVELLRVDDQKMTELDKGILEFKNLVSLNLCGNYIKDIDAKFIPMTLRSLELQANHITDIHSFVEHLPPELLYLGLSKNMMKNEHVAKLSLLPPVLTVLDISDNDICDLEVVLDALIRLPSLASLYLAGNPCSVCAGYARFTLMKLRRLKWLDARKVLSSDIPRDPTDIDVHPDDLRSTYFHFSIFRIMSAPPPPKAEKGATTAFHVELEIPLLDVTRRRFLFFRNNESLTEMLPVPEDEDVFDEKTLFTTSVPRTSKAVMDETSSHGSDIYQHLEAKNSRIINNFTTFESNKVQWAKIMNFQEPTVRIFCPDLIALRDTFRTVITIRLVYSVVVGRPQKPEKKSAHVLKSLPPEQRVTIATIKCALQNPDWSQPSQHFHWDDSLRTNDAIHWGDGDLDILTYSQAPVKVPKAKPEDAAVSRQVPPDNLTCHFGFGIDTLRNLP